jgi:hypothetical protein
VTERNDATTIATAQGLTEALGAMAAEVKQLRTYGRRNRKFIWFDVALTILLTAVSVVAVFAIQSAHDAEQNNRALCLSSNVARAQQIDLWNFAIALGKGKPQTAQQKEITARFEAHLHTLFKPRNCSHVNPGKP